MMYSLPYCCIPFCCNVTGRPFCLISLMCISIILNIRYWFDVQTQHSMGSSSISVGSGWPSHSSSRSFSCHTEMACIMFCAQYPPSHPPTVALTPSDPVKETNDEASKVATARQSTTAPRSVVVVGGIIVVCLHSVLTPHPPAVTLLSSPTLFRG